MDYANTSLASLLWPFAFVCVWLITLLAIGKVASPVLHGMVGGLSLHAKRYAFAYAMCMVYASTASLQALADEATRLGWLYVAASAKVVQPGFVAIIAYVSKSPTPQAKGDPSP